MTLTVSALNAYIKSVLEGDGRLSDIILEGEISNFKLHRLSGHLYFSLKDDRTAVNAVMFCSSARQLTFEPKDGMKVFVRGRVTVFEKSGQYQILVTRMKQAGVGDVYVALEQLKNRLRDEGIFAPEHKKTLPRYPRRIGVITSKSGAAVRDIENILRRRYPIGTMCLYPVLVQGVGAVDSMVEALDWFDREGQADVIIIGRGGGSIEDLWAFNEEKLVRRIYDMKIPVISAVGHETDTTLCDYVADLRAPTPSAAAELAVPDLQKLRAELPLRLPRLQGALKSKTTVRRQRLSRVLAHRAFRNPTDIFNAKRLLLDHLTSRLGGAGRRDIDRRKMRVAVLAERLEGRSPIKIMTAGYTVALSEQGKRLTSVKELSSGQKFTLTLSDGEAGCLVESVTENK